MRLKRWESPRREGRNDKGRGGSARQRQLKKRQQMLRKKLKEGNQPDSSQPDNRKNNKQGEDTFVFPFFFDLISRIIEKLYPYLQDIKKLSKTIKLLPEKDNLK